MRTVVLVAGLVLTAGCASTSAGVDAGAAVTTTSVAGVAPIDAGAACRAAGLPGPGEQVDRGVASRCRAGGVTVTLWSAGSLQAGGWVRGAPAWAERRRAEGAEVVRAAAGAVVEVEVPGDPGRAEEVADAVVAALGPLGLVPPP